MRTTNLLQRRRLVHDSRINLRPITHCPLFPLAKLRAATIRARIARWARPSLALLLIAWVASAMVAQADTGSDRLHQALTLYHRGDLAPAMDIIGPLNASASITPTFGRLAYLKARLAQQLQDESTARQAYTLVWLTYPPLADYAAWALAQDAAEHDNLQTLNALISTLATQYPASLHLPASYLLLAQTQHRLGHTHLAETTVNRFLQAYPSHRLTPQGLHLKAQLAEDATDVKTAITLYRRLGNTYPRHALAAIAFSRLHHLTQQLPTAQRPQPNLQADLATLNSVIQARHWTEVEQRLKRLESAPTTLLSKARRLLIQATVAYKQRRWRRATTLYKRLLLRYPKSPERGEAHYRLARLYRREGKTTESERHYRHAIAQRHDTVWAPKALLKLARTLEQREALAAASELYQQLANTYPTHSDTPSSLWRAGWLQYRLGDYQIATRTWHGFLQRFPETRWRPQLLYWLGRVAQHRQSPAKAQTLFQQVLTEYPLHYYSRRARERLQQLSVPISPIRIPEVADFPWDNSPLVTLSATKPSTATPQQQFHLTRSREFQRLQMHTNARAEISALASLLPKGPSTDFFVATLLSTSQQHLAVFRRLNRIVGNLTPAQVRNLPREFWTRLYPKAFWGDIKTHTSQNSLSPYFVLSLIRQESAFNPRAISGANARGLMQLIPSTARLVARQTGLRPFTLQMLFDPHANIQLGTTYLTDQLSRFNHNPVFALAAYNAGPHRMEKWRERWSALPPDEFVEHIPFNETRLYVKLILRNLLIYETLYNPMSDA